MLSSDDIMIIYEMQGDWWKKDNTEYGTRTLYVDRWRSAV